MVAFTGTARFRIVGPLGQGGMGTVYRAFDTERGMTVALKTINSEARAVDLLRFKREFRALADISHPNLITLGELGEDTGTLYYTMELVDGVDLLSWMRAEYVSADGATQNHNTEEVSLFERGSEPDVAPACIACDPERVRSGLAQLFSALHAIHAAGLVHRDVKPNNVIVRDDGRVVLLDFGIVRELAKEFGEQGVTAGSGWGMVLGTVAYMAPEQAAGTAVGPAADVYAVGVILYEALVGQRPFIGPVSAVLLHKQTLDPAPPSHSQIGLPADLDELCLALLSRDPALRPTAEQALQQLAVSASPPSADGTGSITTAVPQKSRADSTTAFIGRARELTLLDDGRQAVADNGAPAMVIVEGESGIGKTVMVRRFLEMGYTKEDLVIFGRCYERESVPFKGVDAVIDALAMWLFRADPGTVASIVPPRAHDLVAAFPVLARVPAINRAPLTLADIDDPRGRRARVFSAVRALFMRLCNRRRVVVTIDDLQWADDDSLALLAELLRPPHAPPLLVIATVRGSAEADRLTRALCGHELARVDLRRIVLPRLSLAETRVLAGTLAKDASLGPEATQAVERCIDEAGGHPLFLRELVRHRRSEPLASDAPLTLDGIIRARAAMLSAGAQQLLNLVALAPAPVDEELAAAALAAPRADIGGRVAELHAAQLVRTTPVKGRPLLEPWHARVREAVRSAVDVAARQQHLLALASVLEGRAHHDAADEVLYQTFRDAGVADKARSYAARAGERALAALAFDHAARLFAAALEGVTQAEVRRPLLVRLGDACGSLGRGREAATAYLEAAGGAADTSAFAGELRRKAAEQLLRSGHFEDGKNVLATVLAEFSLTLPRSTSKTVLSLLTAEAKNRLRGFAFQPRVVHEIPLAELRRIDVCWSAAMGLAGKDNLGSAYFQARHLSFALAAGERYRISRACSLQAGFSALSGDKGRATALAQLARARDLAIESGHPHAAVLNRWMSAFVDFMSGRFDSCLSQCEEAEALVHATCPDAMWERSNCHVYTLTALSMSGALDEVATRLPAYASEAEARGDVYEVANLPLGPMALVWMARNDVAGARAAIDEAMRRWAANSFTSEDMSAAIAHGFLDLYEGDGARAVARVDDLWNRRGIFSRVVHHAVALREVRARGHLQEAARSGSARSAHLRAAASDIKEIAHASLPWAAPAALLLRASLASLERAPPLTLLRSAASDLQRAGLLLHAAMARRSIGALVGGEEGRRLLEEAQAWLTGRGVLQPETFAAVFAPGIVVAR